jgi:hypothetical protein
VSAAPTGNFWYCMKHRAVETDQGCANSDRIGPFPTASEAADALNTIAARERAYDADDAKWK